MLIVPQLGPVEVQRMEYYEPTVSCSPEAGAVMAIAGAPPVPSMSVDVTVPQLTSVCIVEGPMEKRVAPAGPPEVYENRHRRQLAVHEGRGNGRPTEGGRSAQDISKGASPGRAVECGIVLSYPRSPSARCPRSLAVDPASHSAEQATGGASWALATMDCTMGNRWWNRPRREQAMLVCQKGVHPKVS